MLNRIAFFSFFLLITNFLTAQQVVNSDYTSYINNYKTSAIREMLLYRIPASITLAQGIIESGCGSSRLAIESNNHFGIKCQKEWTGEKYFHDDDEPNECFRKYKDVNESYRDHSLFLTTRSRYSTLFSLPLTDYKGWAKGLKQAGYATNPDYANMLIRMIEANRLYLLDDTTSLTKEEIAALRGGVYFSQDKLNNADSQAEDKSSAASGSRVLYRKNYKFPAASDYEYLYTSDDGRKVYENNGVPFIFAKKGDTWFSIAKDFNIFSFQVYKQNDLLESDIIVPGQILYLEPKKKKNSEHTYKVKTDDSMYSISQAKGVKLNELYKFNKLHPGDEPKPGTELKLSK
jgi:hypothetical protein